MTTSERNEWDNQTDEQYDAEVDAFTAMLRGSGSVRYFFVETTLPDGRSGRVGPYTNETAAKREAGRQRRYRDAEATVVSEEQER